MDEILEIFRRNFPYVSREERTLLGIIHHEGNVTFTRRNSEGRLIGCAIVNGNTILLLVVDKEHRNQGIGSDLLQACEETIGKDGHEKVILGVGFDYLLPGVPTSRRFAPSVHEHLDPLVNTEASDFFEHRGYSHSWGACNCFDMKMSLNDFCLNDDAVGDTINGISYRWATIADVKEILRCADDACQYQDDSFSKYYDNACLYTPGHQQRVLIAIKNGKIVGTLGNRGRGRRECRMHLCCFQRDSSGDSHKYGQTWHEISEGYRTERSQPFIYLFRSGCPIWRLRLRNQHLLFHGRKSNYSTMPNARATAFLINALMVMPAFWAAIAALL